MSVEQQPSYYERNRERIKAQVATYYRTHKDEARARQARFLERHPGYEKTRRASLYARRGDEIRATQRARRAADPEKARLQERKRSWTSQAYIDSLKTAPCMDCGGQFPSYLKDFDHRNGVADKRFEFSSSRSHSFASYEAEASKCDVVCANCHRRRTFRRQACR